LAIKASHSGEEALPAFLKRKLGRKLWREDGETELAREREREREKHGGSGDEEQIFREEKERWQWG
jgi:hypothetical protein